MFVVSEVAVWTSHFVEQTSFRHADHSYATDAEFQATVLDYLAGGDDVTGEERQDGSPGLDGTDDFAAKHNPHIIIFTPIHKPGTTEGVGLRYPHRIEQIKDKLTHLVPGATQRVQEYIPDEKGEGPKRREWESPNPGRS